MLRLLEPQQLEDSDDETADHAAALYDMYVTVDQYFAAANGSYRNVILIIAPVNPAVLTLVIPALQRQFGFMVVESRDTEEVLLATTTTHLALSGLVTVLGSQCRLTGLCLDGPTLSLFCRSLAEEMV